MSEKVVQEKVIDRDQLAELLDKSVSFVIKIAEAENLNDDDAVRSIARTIEETMAKTDRPEFLDYLDTSVVKHASDRGKRRLVAAIDAYTNKFSSQ